MNDPSLESYCDIIYDFFCFSKESCNFFADASNFSVISGNFALCRHSTSFDAIPQDVKIKSGIVPHMLVHVLTKFRSNWAIFYQCMTSIVHPFFTIFFVDQLCASSYLVVSGPKSSNNYFFWITHPFHINDPSLESYDVAVYGFLYFRCLYQAMHVSIRQTFMYTWSAYLLTNLWHCCSFISSILFLQTTSTCCKEIAY